MHTSSPKFHAHNSWFFGLQCSQLARHDLQHQSSRHSPGNTGRLNCDWEHAHSALDRRSCSTIRFGCGILCAEAFQGANPTGRCREEPMAFVQFVVFCRQRGMAFSAVAISLGTAISSSRRDTSIQSLQMVDAFLVWLAPCKPGDGHDHCFFHSLSVADDQHIFSTFVASARRTENWHCFFGFGFFLFTVT